VEGQPRRRKRHFTAYDPVAKWTVGHVASAASASAARVLLDKLLSSAPFKVRGIQVDGGSEFMSVFEDHCRINGLELVVLPHDLGAPRFRHSRRRQLDRVRQGQPH
jgi:hypothetical protein